MLGILRRPLQVVILSFATLGAFVNPDACFAQDAGRGAPGAIQSVSPSQIIDLNFQGGNAAEYLDTVQKAAGGKINIVAMPHVEEISVPPMKLHSVDVAAAVRLLDGEEMQSNDRSVRLSVQFIGATDAGGATPLVKVNAYVKEPRGYTGSQRSSIWSVADLISNGMTADNITTAVSAALELLGSEADKAQVRFHKETSLLLARAGSEQIAIIEQVISELRQSCAQKQSQAMQPMFEQSQRLQEQLQHANVSLDKAQAEATEQLRAAETAKARAEALEAMNNNMRDQLSQRDDQLRAMQMNLDQMAAELMKLKK